MQKTTKMNFESKLTQTIIQDTDNEIVAAIAAAVALALSERHIDEAGIITINNTSKQNRR
jgi:predicted regulator of Ras-like GTPase activity (Roadblock/LC7/MglB family)